MFFLILYVVYCVGMAFNSQIELLVRANLPVPESWNVVKPPTSVTDKNTGKTDVEGGYGVMGDTNVAAAGKANGEAHVA